MATATKAVSEFALRRRAARAVKRHGHNVTDAQYADFELWNATIERVERDLQDLIYDHDPAHEGVTDYTFTTADAIEQVGGAVDDRRHFVLPYLQGAERVGAIKPAGPGKWIVIDNELLYGDKSILNECRALA